MLYHFLYSLKDISIIFNVFKYITFRMICGAITSFILVYFLMPFFIRYMRKKQFGQIIRDEGPAHHKVKTGTPTMGGIIIVSAIILSTLFWCNPSNYLIWIVIFILFSFSFIGFLDDFLKIKRKKNLGLRAREKILAQLLIVCVFYLILFKIFNFPTNLNFPFFKKLIVDIGGFYLIFSMLVILGSSNAMNLTDGLDGLAIVPFIVVAGVYSILSYVAGHIKFANYLYLPYIPQAGELAIFCAILVGAGLGFLWYNAYPAEIFMGDVGSLALGASLGAIAIMIKQEFLLIIAGGLFVLEAISVILQVGYFKITKGKRIFRMAPLHHHFELKGWPENKVVVRFWIVSIICGLIALSTLKIR
ncbi:MAG: UDP-N-acetylmuramyl pentapeptide phosphotransferase/UDP-N-acetylglucosamine-1-phosphate transferase [Thermodesulfobacteria bacterium]|nr:phospho-N-acetylmuramoyl-pentapeptide-transferase [Thermodesulfobacteriota bacterium]MCU4138854.1 UDP-N-acetylmuramyl pentapeptide phosphotransferase/UDP-N-acetylglucosamine-1-phosphate transferase [Thermodesulfobacteriota bacterium]